VRTSEGNLLSGGFAEALSQRFFELTTRDGRTRVDIRR
jgi:hypothetical protein